MSLDKKDKKIIRELLLNSRTPITKLAKKVKLSREVTTYRINKLGQEVIKKYYVIINAEKLGFTKYACFIQLKGISSEQEKYFFKFLKKHPNVTYLGSIIGKWNVVFDVLAKNKSDLEKTLDEIKEKAKDKLDTLIIVGTLIQEEFFPTKAVGFNISLNNRTSKRPRQNFIIDNTDKKILALISENSRVEYKELALKLNLSANTIKNRIKIMEKEDIILGYTVTLDFKELSLDFYNIQIKLINNNELDKFLSFLRNNNKTVYFYNYLGNENWDLDVGLITKSSKELRGYILELRKTFKDSIKIHDIYLILEELKGNYLSKKLIMN